MSTYTPRTRGGVAVVRVPAIHTAQWATLNLRVAYANDRGAAHRDYVQAILFAKRS